LPDVSITVFIKAVWLVFRFMACGFPTGLQCVFYAARSGTLMHQISGISVAFNFRPVVLCICTFAGTSVFQFLFIVHSMSNHVFLTCNIFCLLMKKLVPVSKGHLDALRNATVAFTSAVYRVCRDVIQACTVTGGEFADNYWQVLILHHWHLIYIVWLHCWTPILILNI
jgi:hypothetical protein